MVRRAEDGHRHNDLLKASILCGGYISAGRMEEEEVKRVLFREFEKRDYDTHYDPMATIADGIAKGKTMPIHEIIDQEDKARREMLVNDGDMSFVSSDDEDFRWICDFAEGKIDAGLDTGSKILDEYWRYKANYTIINGHSNVGKTTFALYLMVNSAIRHGWKWIVYSSENRTASIKMKLMSFCANMDVKNMSYANRKRAYEWVSEHFVLISNKQVYSYYDLIVFGEKLLNKDGFNGYFIDPYNSLRIDMSERSGLSTHEYHYEASSEFLTFANNHNIAVWLNMHAVTEAQRRKGADGLPIAPFAEDTEGGGKHVNRSDDFLTFHRKVQAQDPIDKRTIEFHVRKIRETETGSQPTSLDDPIRFQMNMHNTGFVDPYGKPLFKSIIETESEVSQATILDDPANAF
jgi:replicative DNA helicase